jgi:hypothetical protein
MFGIRASHLIFMEMSNTRCTKQYTKTLQWNGNTTSKELVLTEALIGFLPSVMISNFTPDCANLRQSFTGWTSEILYHC